MKYIQQDRVQETTFSCLEELKCDIIENLLLNPEDYRIITIILKSDLAEKLLLKLLDADINGFSLKIHPECNEKNLSNEENVIIELTNEGYVFVEKANLNTYFETDFVYFDIDVNSKWLQKFQEYKNDMLLFDIK
jgi:hypothetical protein